MLSSETITVRLEGAKFYAYHGVFEQEALVGAEYEIDVEVRLHPTEGMCADKLDGTISYADIYKEVERVATGRCMLIERVAIEIGKRLREVWPQILSGCVAVKKTAPPIAGFTGCASVRYDF